MNEGQLEAPAPTGDEREALANLIPLDIAHDRGREGFPRDVYEAADRIFAAGFRRPVQAEPRITIVHEDGNTVSGTPEQVLNHGHLKPGWKYRGSELPAEPTVTVATKPAIDEVRKLLDYYADEIDTHIWQEIASALDDIPDCESWTAVPHAEHVQAEPTERRNTLDAADAAFKKREGNATWAYAGDRGTAVKWHWRGFLDGVVYARHTGQEGESR